jgi:hypothetical protein
MLHLLVFLLSSQNSMTFVRTAARRGLGLLGAQAGAGMKWGTCEAAFLVHSLPATHLTQRLRPACTASASLQ